MRGLLDECIVYNFGAVNGGAVRGDATIYVLMSFVDIKFFK